MTFLAPLWHLLGLVAPALATAALLVLGLRLRRAGAGGKLVLRSYALIAGVGVLVMVAGLVWFGRDAKMATYAALVVIQGTLAWWLRGR